MTVWVIGPAARGARKIFGRPVGANGEVDASGVDHQVLLRLAADNIIQMLPTLDLGSLTTRIEQLEADLKSAREQNAELLAEVETLRGETAGQVEQLSALQARVNGAGAHNRRGNQR